MNQLLFFVLKMITVVSVLIGYIIYNKFDLKNKKIKSFPPWKSKCPDMWEVVDETKCKNVHNIGSCSITSDKIMDFNEAIFKTKDSDYYKCTWAKECGLSWEGIDNLCI